jgi:hypothetical protein
VVNLPELKGTVTKQKEMRLGQLGNKEELLVCDLTNYKTDEELAKRLARWLGERWLRGCSWRRRNGWSW